MNMQRRLMLLIFATTVTALTLTQAGLVQASQVVSGYKLEKGKATVPYGQEVSVWSCWEPGSYTNPSLYAWTGRSWTRWAVGDVSTNSRKCKRGHIYVVFSFTVSQKGSPKSGADYNVVKVKETCRGCEPYVWLMPVRLS